MAHYAEVGEDNIVIRVCVVGDDKEGTGTDEEKELVGRAWCVGFFPDQTPGSTWYKASYNGNYRGKAGVGLILNTETGKFVSDTPQED